MEVVYCTLPTLTAVTSHNQLKSSLGASMSYVTEGGISVQQVRIVPKFCKPVAPTHKVSLSCHSTAECHKQQPAPLWSLVQMYMVTVTTAAI